MRLKRGFGGVEEFVGCEEFEVFGVQQEMRAKVRVKAVCAWREVMKIGWDLG